jgi:hypothetical protein
VPRGARSASFTISTHSVTSQDFVFVSADAPWSNSSGGALVTINP